MTAVSSYSSIRAGMPVCKTREHFDANAETSNLVTTDRPISTKINADCNQGVQTMSHPPVALEPVIMKPPINPFRKQVLWKYPFLVNKDSLYDKREERFRDPEEMISTYRRDYGCDMDDIELVRSTGHPPLPDLSPKRYPTLGYMPKNAANISTELAVFYALPGGRWALNAREKRTVEPPKPVHKAAQPKWESEYQANINGLAKYMTEMKVLTRKVVRVRRVPTLPED